MKSAECTSHVCKTVCELEEVLNGERDLLERDQILHFAARNSFCFAP